MRLGIVGAGRMGERIAQKADAVEGVMVTAIVDRDGDRARLLAASSGAEVFESIQAARDVVDAVYIGAPNSLHARMCIDAAEIGAHILVDKPMCLTAAEAESVRTAVDSAGVRLMVGFSYRFRREWMTAKRWISEGKVGAVKLVADTLTEAAESVPGWYADRASGGGVVHLQGHHCIDRAAWLLGEAIAPVSIVTDHPKDGGAEMYTGILARSGSGVAISLNLGLASGYTSTGFAQCLIQGDDGHVVINSLTRTAILVASGEVLKIDASEDDWLGREVETFVGVTSSGDDFGSYPGWREGEMATRFAETALDSMNLCECTN